MVVRKCEENDKDALRWCVAKPDKRKSRKMTNKIFSAMMYEMMGWNLDCRYKILGHKITFEDETIYVFDLMETEIFLDIKGKRVKKDTESQATINDVDGLGVFAQQLFGYGRKGDVFLGISTSGNSKNILNATVVARASGIKVVGLTGAKGGELAKVADVAVKAPETETYMIQEVHLPIYHCWCLMLEDHFFGM